MQRASAQFIDVREPEEFETASIEGFQLYPLTEASGWLKRIDQDLDPHKDTYVLCHHGVRSMHVCQMLVHKGFDNLYNVTGGIAQYSSQVDPAVPQY